MTDPFNPRFRIRSDHAAAIAVTLAPVIYFLPALYHGRVLCPADGIIQNVPFRVTFAQMLRSGYLPLWDPYIFSGMPLLAAAQPAVLYPLNWFYLAFSPATATNLMVIATYIVAGLGAFLYARRIGFGVSGSLMTALVWQFCGATIGQISHINIVQTSTLLPWILWSLEAFAQTGTVKRGAVLAALIAIQFFAGHQQTFVYSLLLTVAYAIAMSFTRIAERKRYLWSLAFVAIGLLLATVQILPTFELLRNSPRAAATYDFFTSYSLPKRFVLALFAPYLMGGGDGRLFRAVYVGPPYYPEMIGYVGVVALMLGIMAMFIKRDARTKFWGITFVAALLLAFGRYTPLHVYRIIYFVPMLNLFRVPARHLMEVDFALAVLAGRGLTVLTATRERQEGLWRAAVVAMAVLLFTIITVLWLRPSAFHLDREVPATLLRAPELFLPILVAGASAWAVWRLAKQRRGSVAMLFAVLLVDLFVWGQSSGWYASSPVTTGEYWRVPAVVQTLRNVAPNDNSSYRILTVPQAFDPSRPVPSGTPNPSFWTQPDIYMLHQIHNAAGYDGFGFDRYQKMAGNMKVWGELTDPDSSLRGDSREIDLLNVRYVIASRPDLNKAEPELSSSAAAQSSVEFSGFRFASDDLGLPAITRSKRADFTVVPVEVDRIALVTNLAWAENVPDNTVVARIRVESTDGRQFDLPLRAGVDTSEWAYDRADIRSRIRHRRATVATSYGVNDPSAHYEAHTFVTSLPLPEKTKIARGEIEVTPNVAAPELALSLIRISLIDSAPAQTYPLQRTSIRVLDADQSPSHIEAPTAEHWKLLAQLPDTRIFENLRVMPRAWLVSETRVLDANATLEVMRTGKFADGSIWDPARIALVESEVTEKPQNFSDGSAAITKYEPNRVELNTKSNAASMLVLSENHYPGWRAYVDGRLVETLRVDYNLRGVTVPAGEHKVEFVYRPKSVLIGLALSLLTLLGLALALPLQKKFIGRFHGLRR
jgi:hypothetical protein